MAFSSFVWFLLWLASFPPVVADEHDLADDGAHGIRIAGNDLFTVFARNSELLYKFSFALFKSCEVSYLTDYHYYVYSLAVLNSSSYLTNPPNFTFVQVAETFTSEPEIILSILIVHRFSFCHIIDWYEIPVWKGTHQTYMQIKVDPSNQYVYVFADSFVLSFDLATRSLIELKNITALFDDQYLPRAFDLTDKWAVVTGVEITFRSARYLSWIIQLQPFIRLAHLYLEDNTVENTAKAKIYDRTNQMSVAINPRKDMALISYPARQRVLLVYTKSPTHPFDYWTMPVKKIINWPNPNDGFGRSVAWLDDETVAVTMFTVPDRPWSRSEVWMFAVDEPFDKPLFVFPNNQQVVMLSRLPLFLHILSWSNNLHVLTDQSKALLIPARPAGFLSVWPDKHNADIIIYESAPCMAGTYQNRSHPGPCSVCPAQTMNSAGEVDKPATECVPCPSNSFCPLGSVDVVHLDALPSYVQSYSYPASPEVNNYDDILLQTVFDFTSFSRCLVISPLFWTLLAIGLCTVIYCIIIWLKSSKVDRIKQWRRRTKTVFRQIDPFNHEKQWVGGLFALSVGILLGFVYWFAFRYLQAYPIESVSIAQRACSDTNPNSQFDHALQLPLPSVDGNNWEILDMLNKQQLTMSVDLVNTAIHCSNITVRHVIPRAHHLSIAIDKCASHIATNATRSFTFHLPSHPSTVELIMYGPYFIGGIRFCLRGSGLHDNMGNTLQSLDVCQFYSADNQTLGRIITLSIVLIKTINQTHPLESNDNPLFHGRWTPTWNHVTGMSDEFFFEQYGQHQRYASDRSTVVISLSEQPFFLQNNQQPIVRKFELIFHTLLFTSLVIQMFTCGFIITKQAVLLLNRFRPLRSSRQDGSNNDAVSRRTNFNVSNDISIGNNDATIVIVDTD